MLSSSRNILLFLLTAFIVFFIFFPCLHADFLNIDDQEHFLQNHYVLRLSPDSVKGIFTQTVNNVYIPLTTLSFTIEHHFFGFNTFVFHLDNLILHVANVLLVLFLARRMGLSSSAAFLAAFIFGIHPMKVESVAWVTERKDVLYALFYLLALHQYWSYLKTKSTGAYLGALLFGLISILTKPMALSLPMVLLLFDWFDRRRWDKNVLIEKIPFFLYTIEIGSLSYLFNMRNPISDMGQAALIWIWSFNFYICKFLWPWHVSFVYFLPHPITLANWPYAWSLVLFVFIVGALIRWRNNRWMIFAFGYYFLSIFFLLRFDESGDFTVVSDRFMYLSSLGFCLGIGVGLERLLKTKYLMASMSLILIVFLGTITFKQCRVWYNSIALWDQIVRENPSIYVPYFMRGVTYTEKGQYNAALADFSRAIDLDPLLVNAYYDRAFIYFSQKRYKEAMVDINRAIQLDPADRKAYLLRTNIEEKKNK